MPGQFNETAAQSSALIDINVCLADGTSDVVMEPSALSSMEFFAFSTSDGMALDGRISKGILDCLRPMAAFPSSNGKGG